jgi:hypothetical protein
LATSIAITDVPLFIAIIIGVLFVIIAVIALSRNRARLQPANRYLSHGKDQQYVPGQFSSQMELDMRLPYRRFKQLYPGSRLTYEEYKKVQMQTAFRRSMSSQENHRMVR